MASGPLSRTTAVESAMDAKAAGIPWPTWCAALAVTSAVVGAHWDISWHRSIGRDTFWTPAHMAIYLCGVLAGISSAYLILDTTFNKRAAMGENSVRIWGFRGPLGAFIAAWGGIAMLTSAPFDNWWHDAYGLDVKIVSPPHVVLFLGAFGVSVGALILALAQRNRSSGASTMRFEWLFLYVGALIVILLQMLYSGYVFWSIPFAFCVGALIARRLEASWIRTTRNFALCAWTFLGIGLLLEFTAHPSLHTTLPYRMEAIFIPFVLAGIARVSSHRFSATILTGLYSIFLIGTILILPLFPAQPKLGPVYRPVTHFIPNQFPILLIVPAFLLDVFWHCFANWNKWLLAAGSAVLFTGALLVAEWPFASFLQSPAARNAFFGAGYLDYATPPNSSDARYVFDIVDTGALFWMNIAAATAFAFVSTRLGFSWGEWMRKVKR